MNLTLLKKLVRILEKSGVDEIEVEEEGLRVRLAKNPKGPVGPAYAPMPPPPGMTAGASIPAVAPSPAAGAAPPATKVLEVKSPIVGTFYRAPAPDADSYVEVGDEVPAKAVLCLIEAMKLMNEIETDVGGRIVKILVDNGQAVEYNQVLFHIEPA